MAWLGCARVWGPVGRGSSVYTDVIFQVLANVEADLISFARAYIANPDLVECIRTGAPLAEAPQEYWYGGDETGYSDWPAMESRAA